MCVAHDVALQCVPRGYGKGGTRDGMIQYM